MSAEERHVTVAEAYEAAYRFLDIGMIGRATSVGAGMRIGELTRLTGVSARSLRYYEGIGLVRSTRTCGGWRDFDEAAIERVILIQHLFAAGLSGTTIKEILPCLEVPVDQRTGMLDGRLAEEVKRLEASKREIERELGVLRAFQDDTARLDG